MDKKKRANVFKTIVSSLRLTAQSGGGGYLAFTSVWMLITAFTSLTAVFQKYFVNAAADLLGGVSTAFRTALFWLGIWAGVELLSAVMNIFTQRAQVKLWNQVEYYVQYGIMKKISRIRLSYFDNVETHRILEFVKARMHQRLSGVIDAVFGVLLAGAQFVTVGVIIAGENPWAALMIIAASIPAVYISYRQTEENYWNEQNNSHESRFQAYVGWLLTRRKFLKEMQFYNLFDYIFKRYDESTEILNKTRIKSTKKYMGLNVLGSLINYIAIGIALVLIVLDIYSGKRGIGSFVLIYSSARNLQSAVEKIFSSLLVIGSEGRYIEEYYTVMEYEEEKYEVNPQQNQAEKITITFQNVSFTYPQTDRLVLKNLNLEIKQGEKIAIIGENGSGKSTFIALLTGLYQPTEGQILVNGIDISENLGILRDNLSCTYQNFVHYELTIKENILLGDLGYPHTDEDVACAAKKAGIYEEIMAMPDGFDTPLGNYAKNGRDLSGGQWQKLAMAKNLLKDSAKIMILDEPTAALDPVAESDLYREFGKLTSDKTVLLISHRLGATRLADRILVFHEGAIVEDGSHEELMKKNGLYTSTYHAQSQWYTN